MATIHMQRIKGRLERQIADEVDVSDLDGRSEPEVKQARLSRSLAAYALIALTGIDVEAAVVSITDTFDDNGVDAIHFDAKSKTLYLVQAKWFESGHGSIALGDFEKFATGFLDIVNLRLDRFNDRVRGKESILTEALLDSEVQLCLVITYTGTEGISKQVERRLSDLLEEHNNPEEVLRIEILNQAQLYSALSGGPKRSDINLEIALKEWGRTTEPYVIYYGMVDANNIGDWWKTYGSTLFADNIRGFKGSTDVNRAMTATLQYEPQHLMYFNNGLTVLCTKVLKKPFGGQSRDIGLFDCQGVSIVNGAQTVGVIGAFREKLGVDIEGAKVLVRILSLEDCPSGFEKVVTRATNTQNRIERRDFAALDPNQHRLSVESSLDGKKYVFKTGEPEPSQEEGCSIVEATVALACADTDVTLAVQAKREIGRLWDDIEAAPYTTLFNDDTTAVVLWKTVEIMRLVDATLKNLSKSQKPRADMIAIHGNRLILHRVFMDSSIRSFRRSDIDIDSLKSSVGSATERAFLSLCDHLESKYPNAYLASLFKNQSKCREVDRSISNDSQTKTAAPIATRKASRSGQPKFPGLE